MAGRLSWHLKRELPKEPPVPGCDRNVQTGSYLWLRELYFGCHQSGFLGSAKFTLKELSVRTLCWSAFWFVLWCCFFFFQHKKIVDKGYLYLIKLAKPKPSTLSSVLWQWDLWEKERWFFFTRVYLWWTKIVCPKFGAASCLEVGFWSSVTLGQQRTKLQGLSYSHFMGQQGHLGAVLLGIISFSSPFSVL